ncbi:hypothetical protein PM082_012500 [Marasmius tenuissimus]|nr:hypothetical protein PM082_012500 [Marasmius tenuissimus]
MSSLVLNGQWKDSDLWESLPVTSFFVHNLKEMAVHLVNHFMTVVHIAFAFTMSDMKTIIIPVMCYGLMSAPSMPGLHVVIHLLVWIWLYLLQFCAANQMYSPDEDGMNKPYRPIPSGLMTTKSTYKLRWALVPICLWLSWKNGVLIPGIVLTLAFMAYNEGGLDSQWYSKNFLNAVGIVSWDVGASIIAAGAGQPDLNDISFWIVPLFSVGLIWTTIHVQDFRDEVGDRLQGRTTFPTLLPEGSRYITFIVINSWTAALGCFWNLSMPGYCLFLTFGCYLSLRIFFQRSEDEDKVTLRVYMIWLTIARTLPYLQVHASMFMNQ